MLTDFLFSVALGLAAAHGLSLVAVCRLLIAALLSLQSTGAGVRGLGSCGSWAREHRLRSFGAWA